MAIFLPQLLLERRIECAACKKQMPIPFKNSRREVIEPVIPNDFHPQTNNRHWVCIGTQVNCDHCAAPIDLPLPTVTHKTDVHLFADEAARMVDGRNIWVFAAVGCDKRLLPQVDAQVRDLKTKVIPGKTPTDWIMHMKDIWSGDARAKHPLFSTLTRDAVRKYIDDVAALYRNLGEDLFTFVCIVSKPVSAPAGEPMKLSFSVLFSELMHGFTKGGSAPLLHLDAQRPASIQSQAVGWIDAILTEQRHILAYPFLTHGIAIPRPKIIAPGSAPCAELADFAAFWIARYHERKWRGLDVELDPSQLGNIFYVVEKSANEVVVTRQPQFPWDMCYNVPPAVKHLAKASAASASSGS